MSVICYIRRKRYILLYDELDLKLNQPTMTMISKQLELLQTSKANRPEKKKDPDHSTRSDGSKHINLHFSTKMEDKGKVLA